ncbi:MAG: methyltransferase domain-containing protein [Microbacteriaceae bacterium]|nr:methyltransferase domain-containing protein [Microbacteriaceae bacterium]
MQCDYFDRGECRSCTLMGVPRARQLADKEARARAAVPGEEVRWLPAFAGPEAAFRNKAKMVVGGTVEAPTLGILDAAQRGVDLSGCGITSEGLRAAFPAIRAFITAAGLVPYDVAARRGELKHVLVTEAPDGALMARFVLRSTEALPRVRKHLPALREALPRLAVATANILPAHVALLEGDEEHVLTSNDALTMRVGELDLALPPRSFFQTNTAVAAALYRQAAEWAEGALRLGSASLRDPTGSLSERSESKGAPARVWDLYCGVGGFALALAGPGREIVGVETSAEAIAAATRAGVPGTAFIADDATRWAREQPATQRPDLVVVNPPRRGLGPDLADWLESSGVPTVIYSSCNPDTLARDLARMPSYRAVEARPFDMFPQTEHLEVMVLLERV